MRLIDADKLVTQIPKTSVDIFENCRNCRLLDDLEVRMIISNAPTIEAELRKHGRWEAIWHSIFKAYLPTCSECGGISPIKYKYCPYCGSQMFDEVEE